MDFQKYLYALTGELVSQPDVVDVTCNFMSDGDIARVRVRCTAGNGVGSVSHYVYVEDVDAYGTLNDGDDLARILKAIRVG